MIESPKSSLNSSHLYGAGAEGYLNEGFALTSQSNTAAARVRALNEDH